jgi:hypothetical protein
LSQPSPPGPQRTGPGRRLPALGEALRYAQSGTMLVAPMIGLGAIGLWADRRYGTGPWLLLAGLILGMIGGFVNFFRMVLPPRDGGGSGR